MSNDAWECKRDELQEHSVLLLNNELLAQSSWSEDTIESRSQRMAELVWHDGPVPILTGGTRLRREPARLQLTTSPASGG